MMNAINTLLTPLYYAVSAVLLAWHWLFSHLFGANSGATWALSIVGLVLVIRTCLIPLFVKQIRSSRNMQVIQPKVKELQKKYGHDREKLAAETMALYKETGTNPFASCLPILLQMPIFLSLFRLIDHAAKGQTRGLMTPALAKQFADATLLGAKISDSFTSTHLTGVRVLAALLVVAMTATTFLTQRQLMSKNMPADAMTGQYAQQQKMLLYVLPVVFAVGGIAFPIGVLFYWTTSNLWTMCQQFYVIRNNPAPGTPAAKAKQDRDAVKRERKGLPDPATPLEPKTDASAPPAPEAPKRQQPRNQTRSQRKKSGPPSARPPQSAPGRPVQNGPNGPPSGSSRAADPDDEGEADRKGA